VTCFTYTLASAVYSYANYFFVTEMIAV